jgi:hypothetical protein
MTELLRYDVGDQVTMLGSFADPVTGDPVDPVAVTCNVRRHDGTQTSAATTKVKTGEYKAVVTIDRGPKQAVADWWFAFDGSGTYQSSAEQRFLVNRQEVAR